MISLRKEIKNPQRPSDLPKVIHHTWKHPHLHPHLHRCVDSFRKWNPDWTLRFWTDAECERFIAEELPNFLSTYLGYPKGILRADIFRIAVLYIHGGVYADLDMECLRPLDELLEAATGGNEDWEMLLNRDHPVHEDHIWHGGPMWMNAFMIAKPGSIYLGMLLSEFTRQLREGEVDESDPVMTTGPGLLTDLIGRHRGGLAALGIREIPWHWVHPLPNVQLPFERKPQYEYLIRCRTWRDGVQPAGINTPRRAFAGFEAKEPPFAAHYWWHSYIERCKIVNMLTRHGASLLQSDAEIVERRLGDLPPDVCPQSLGETLCQFAERGGTRILLSGQSPPVGLTDLLNAAGAALDWRVEEAPGLVSAEGNGADLSGEGFDLHIELSSGANGHPVSDESAFPTLREGGLYLRLEEGRDAKLNGSGTSAELRPLSGEYPIFEKRPDPGRETPPILHWLETPSTTPLNNATFRSWEACHPSDVWGWRRWTMEGIEQLIAEKEPTLLPTFHDYPIDEHRRLAGRWVILKHFGGAVVQQDSICLHPVGNLLSGGSPRFSTRSLPNGGYEVTDHWLSSPPGHPFWNGLISHLEANRFKTLGEAVGVRFLNERCDAAPRLLDPGDWPLLARAGVFGFTLEGNDWLRLVHCGNWAALAQMAPAAVTLSLRGCPEGDDRVGIPDLAEDLFNGFAWMKDESFL